MRDYPRPPRVEPTQRRIRGEIDGITLFDSHRAQRVLETWHPPVYYVPREDVSAEHVIVGEGSSYCEWKGRAIYFDVVTPRRRVARAAWQRRLVSASARARNRYHERRSERRGPKRGAWIPAARITSATRAR